MTQGILALHESAVHWLGRLEEAGAGFAHPELLVFASMSQEAIASSTIEGTVATPEELVLFQLEAKEGSGRVREVANYNSAVAFGIEELSRRPISVNLILELHGRLMAGVRGERFAGRFKQVQNFIGRRPGDRIEDAVFVPSPPESVPRLMGELEAYLNLPQMEPTLVKAALAHHQFETIHPFGDGNGRVGRLVILLGLVQEGLLSRPVIYPSAYFERHRADYYRLLTTVRERGDWEEWLDFFVRAIVEQAQESLELVGRLTAARSLVLESARAASRGRHVRQVVDCFFVHPVRSVAQVASRARVSDNTARSVVEDMEAAGILREVTGLRKRRSYLCEPVWRAIFK